MASYLFEFRMISIPWPRSATTENPLERYLQWVVDLWFSSVWLKPLEFFLRFYNHSPKINVNSPWDASVLLHTNHSIEAEVSFKGLFKYELCSLDWILSFQSFPYIYFHDFIAAMLDDLKIWSWFSAFVIVSFFLLSSWRMMHVPYMQDRKYIF